MDRNQLNGYYADNVGLIHMVTKKGWGRLQAIGASYPYDDLFQELSVIFIKAFDGFDDNCGNKFSTYFMTSAYHEVNKIVAQIAIERIDMKTRSVEEMSSWSEDGLDEAELLPCLAPTPAERCELSDSLKNMMQGLSPLALKIVTLAIDPPDFVEYEFAAAGTHVKLARDSGVERRFTTSLNVNFICALLEKLSLVTPTALRKARQEIQDAARSNFQ